MRQDRQRLQDILHAIKRIERHAVQGREAFESEELIQAWMLYHIQIIGEAASKITGETRETHPEIAWAEIIAMRNVLVHDYFGIDLDEVWNTVERDIPKLKAQIEAALKEINSK